MFTLKFKDGDTLATYSKRHLAERDRQETARRMDKISRTSVASQERRLIIKGK